MRFYLILENMSRRILCLFSVGSSWTFTTRIGRHPFGGARLIAPTIYPDTAHRILKCTARRTTTHLTFVLWVDDIFIERRSALEAGEGHNLGDAVLLGCVEFIRALMFLLLQCGCLDTSFLGGGLPHGLAILPAIPVHEIAG